MKESVIWLAGIKNDLGNEVKRSFMAVKVLFFGVLAEVAGTDCKHYHGIRSIGELKLRIEDDFPELEHYNFRISLNNDIIDDDPILSENDEVGLLPPFAGG